MAVPSRDRRQLQLETILRKSDMAILVSATSSPYTRLVTFVLPTPIDRAQRDRNATLLEDSFQSMWHESG